MNLIDVDTLKEKEQYIPCGNNLLFHGVTAATIDAMPTIGPETLPIVKELWEKLERERKICDDLQRELVQVAKERDAAASFIPKTCATCKYSGSPCDWCAYDPDGDMNWEWNGKAKENCNDRS